MIMFYCDENYLIDKQDSHSTGATGSPDEML
jgi:hypothetical protein